MFRSTSAGDHATPLVQVILIALMLMIPGARPAWAVSTEILLAPTGEAADDAFGASVGTAGDVNGDGFDDLIVGARSNDAGGAEAGRAYVYFGGPGADATPDVTFTGEAAGDQFGSSVGTAGDVNGDGFDDLIVGARSNDAGGAEAGRAYVYFGGPGADATPDVTFTGEAAGDQFGSSVGTAGDVNGDGFDDLIVGASQNDAGGSSAGSAYVFYGGAVPDVTADVTFTGEAADDLFGSSVGTAGDVNGDGFDDLIVGAIQQATSSGVAYLFYGGPGVDDIADLTLTGSNSSGDEEFGGSVGTAGDVNGDGYDDVIVGQAGTITSDLHRAYVFYGGPGVDAIADLTLTAEAPGDSFGHSVGTAGDVNGDGFDDLVIGAYQNDAGGSGAGRAYVFYGGPGADTSADVTFTGEAAGDSFGFSVGTAGDVNGDGFDDLIIGAHRNDAGGSGAGRAFVYSVFPYRLELPNGGEQWVAGQPAQVRWRGHDVADLDLSVDGGLSWSNLASGVGGDSENEYPVIAPGITTEFALVRLAHAGQAPTHANSVTSAAVFRIVAPQPAAVQRLQLAPVGEAADDSFGWSVGAARDVNGDGFDDLIVGASLNDAGGSSAGRAYVFYTDPRADATADLIFTGEAAGDRFGNSVGTAGDVNGDGFDDLIVGANGNDIGGASAGRAYVYYGGPSADVFADLTFTGEAAGDELGVSVGTAGDVNGDGFDDLIVGALFNSTGGSSAGRAYVYHGGPGADTNPDLIFTGEAANDNFGVSVGTAGDLNGDGFDDLIVGALFNSTGGSGAGRAYVYHGGPGADATADLIFTGGAANDNFGVSVSTAGDVNGDGFDDLIVGADGNDTGGSNAGRAYVYHGGPGADTSPDLIFTGGAANDNFGVSVGTAGDVNGDGFDDVIVGAHRNDGGGSNAGRVYVYHGGPGADTVADITLTGEAAEDQFGSSVGTAGDVNADGFNDVVVGAFGSDAGASDAGRTYVYDCNRYHVLTPVGGETWNVGASETITWLGAEPADVWLSVDGGNSYSLLDANVGGDPANALGFVVPHRPTLFARAKITPHDSAVTGSAKSDSLFTIEASITLLNLRAAPVDGGGVLLSWETDPGLDDLAGYKLERSPMGADAWTVLESLARATEYHDGIGAAGMRYRLSGVNGLGEELLLGETVLTPRAVLAAWPLPYRGGNLRLSFATYGRLGEASGRATVTLHDLRGRLVRTIADGNYEAGYQVVTWDGQDEGGGRVSSGVYFLRAVSARDKRQIKLVVVR